MTSLQSLFQRRWFQTFFTVYMTAALTLLAALAAWAMMSDEPAELGAEHLETNEEGALFKITAVRGPDGERIRWDELETSLPVMPLLDIDGIVQAEEVFFVPTREPGLTHVVTIAYEGKVLWSGAFDAEDDRIIPLPLPPPLPDGVRGSDIPPMPEIPATDNAYLARGP